MVVIRLARHGAKKTPFYHVVAIDSRKRRQGRPLERLGYSNPVAKGQAKALVLDVARIEHWIGQGAQMTDTVARLVKGYHPEQSAAANDATTAKATAVKAEAVQPTTAKVNPATAEAAKAEASKDDTDKA